MTERRGGQVKQRPAMNLAEIRRRLPFPLSGLDSDKGGEFINRVGNPLLQRRLN